LFQEYAEVLFDLMPLNRNADDLVSREDAESLRLRLVAIGELVAMKMADDAPLVAVVPLPPDADRPAGEERS
jgi:hypothetical protein